METPKYKIRQIVVGRKQGSSEPDLMWTVCKVEKSFDTDSISKKRVEGKEEILIPICTCTNKLNAEDICQAMIKATI